MPLAPTIPNLAQLQHFRRTGKFDPGIQAGKLDVMKSARVVGVKVGEQFIGFGTVERATPEEIARLLKSEVSKSAELPPDDPNEVFDDSPLLPHWQPQVQPIGFSEVVQKSAEVETAPDVLEGIFPKWLQTS
jgi:hypothetical protein